MRFGVVVFPGSDAADCYYIIDQVLGHSVSYVWYQERDLNGFDCVILPGGFSYGNYLRAGAVAAVAPVMDEVVKYAEQGGLVLGIGNGFQVLLEAGLLAGALRRNEIPRFRCHDVSSLIRWTSVVNFSFGFSLAFSAILVSFVSTIYSPPVS
jgi:phosphoribosylformylglycinamidine (FGAM) synthase-like amidotransferase family enzyme